MKSLSHLNVAEYYLHCLLVSTDFHLSIVETDRCIHNLYVQYYEQTQSLISTLP